MPMVYSAAAFLIGVLVLPSALRPPPNPAQTSNALNPNAPPNQTPPQIIESLQQAGGGGAGAAAGGGTGTTLPGRKAGATTSTLPQIAAPPPTIPSTPSLDYCYGNPPRQIPSIYAGPCVGAWQGNNGGATSLNVFPNEVRIGFNNLDSPSAGPLPDPSSDNASTSSQVETFQALDAYFNEHSQFYYRKIVIYGTGDPAQSTADSYAANADTLAQSYHLFAIADDHQDVCEDFERYGLVALCDPLPHQQYLDYRPGLFTYQQMDLDELMGFGSEFACKSLVGKDAQFGGPAVVGKVRKLGYIGFQSIDGGEPASAFAAALAKECGASVDTATLVSESDVQGAAAAIARFQSDGVTSIVFALPIADILLAMTAASRTGYEPEWVVLGSYAIDNNTIATVLPKDQSSHLFGITNQEWTQVFSASDCYQAVESVDPSLSPNGTVCYLFWPQLVWIANGIQGAGPDLTPARFQQAEFAVGYRFGWTPWAMGGGFGIGNFAFPHSVSEIWYNSVAQDPSNGATGAYEYLFDGEKFQRGQLPSDTSQFFKGVSAQAPSTCAPTPAPC
jgi:hypothetical protein